MAKTRRSRGNPDSSNRSASAGSSRRERAPSARQERASSRTSKKSSKQSAKKPSRQAARPAPMDREERAQMKAEAKAAAQRKNRLVFVVIGVVIVVAICAALYVPGMLRAAKLSALASAATPPEMEQKASDYLAHVDYQEHFVDQGIRSDTLSLEAKLALGRMAAASDGRSRPYVSLMWIARLDEANSVDRAEAVSLAADVYHPKHHGSANAPRREIRAWAAPEDSVGPDERALAAAAQRLVAILDHREGWTATEILSEIAKNSLQDLEVRLSAGRSLAKVTNSRNVGSALGVYVNEGAPAMIACTELTQAVEANVLAEHLPMIFKMWDSADEGVVALGYRAAGGNLVNLPTNAAGDLQRQEIGAKVAGYLTDDLYTTSREKFAGLMEVIEQLALVGVSDRLLELVPQIDDPELQDKVATILGRAFIHDRNEVAAANSAKLIETLANSLAAEDRRAIAAKALSRVKVSGMPELRLAVEAAAPLAEDENCRAVLENIVGKLYSRKDVVEAKGANADAWVAFLEQDRPNFELYQEAIKWYNENAQVRVGMFPNAELQKMRNRAHGYTETFTNWIEGDSTQIPLGLTITDLKSANQSLGGMKTTLVKAFSGAE